MREFKYQLINDPRLFNLCRDIDGDNDLYSVFEVQLNGEHFEYLYRDNSTTEYTSTPKSHFNAFEISQLKQAIENELNKKSG